MLKQTRTIAHVKEIFVAPNAIFCVGRTDVKNSTKIVNLNLSYLGLKLSVNFPAVHYVSSRRTDYGSISTMPFRLCLRCLFKPAFN